MLQVRQGGTRIAGPAISFEEEHRGSQKFVYFCMRTRQQFPSPELE
jgi:hypothetical protein